MTSADRGLVALAACAMAVPVCARGNVEARLPLPLTGLCVVAMPNEGVPQRVELPWSEETSGANMIGSTYRVEWRRESVLFHVKVTRLDDRKYWRLAVESRFTPMTSKLSLRYFDLPVNLPLSRVKKAGQYYWFWTPGAPGWLVAEGGGHAAGLAPMGETAYGFFAGPEVNEQTMASRSYPPVKHHGFFLNREQDGSFNAQFCLDAWQVQDTAEVAFRVVDDVGGRQLLKFRGAGTARRSAGATAGSPAKGFIRVDAAGTGFVTPDGKPFRAMGKNVGDFPTLRAKDQERILSRMVASRMNTLRLLTFDWAFAPLPGVWNEEALIRLRQALDRCAAHGLRAIVTVEYSPAGYQYQRSVHLSPCCTDLYLMKESLVEYAETVRRVVTPLRNHPGVLAWSVTNEPYVAPDRASLVQRTAFRDWLVKRYGTLEKLRAAWGASELRAFAAVEVPDQKSCDDQSTPAARDFFVWSNQALAEGMVARARLIRQADPNHLTTISAGNPRLFRGVRDAELFDFWAPHTYDLWINGPEISRHVLFLTHSLRFALPDRPRPVVIEEFGINEDPQFADDMRAEHVRQFREAGERWGLAGLLHWWEMSPAMEAQYAATSAPLPYPAPNHQKLAVYLPPSQEFRNMVYSRYMTRRQWDKALAEVVDRGWAVRFVSTTEEARGCDRLLVLGDALAEEEVRFVRDLGLPVWVLPGAEKINRLLPDATELP